MVLLSSNAHHVFWLGRYLTRINVLCGHIPFQEDAVAAEYAHAFCLPAWNATSLNALILDPDQPFSLFSQFQTIKGNIQELRAVLSSKGYAELNQIIKAAHDKNQYICQVTSDCAEIIEAEDQNVFLFYSLGKLIETLDTQLRLNQNVESTLNEVETILMVMQDMGWHQFQQAWEQLKSAPDMLSFYNFHDKLEYIFEEGV